MLGSKKVLLILDDVDHLTQLETLAGACDWFGEGSRIIITTRDQHLLTTHGVVSTYKMTRLDQNDAFQLFCWHAFKRDKPSNGYGEFVEQIVNYAGSLPLALVVLGSDLYGRSESEWISAMDEYKQIPHEDIQKILQTSYDRLRENEKNAFRDIACFFDGEQLDDVINMLDIFGFSPNFSIPRLKEKCLISEFDGRLQMHNLLRDMGREVVRQESPKIPEVRSRLFIPAEVRDVLENDTGGVNVEAILVDLPKGDDIIHLSPKAFENMRRLRFFRVCNAQFVGDQLESLPDEIRVIDWPKCPLQYLPPKFRGNKLVILRMPDSLIRPIRFEFKNLTIMDFSDCQLLTECPDISSCPNLKEMHLNYCRNLVEVHDSVGFCAKLSELSLDECSNLKSFSKRLQLRSLRFLSLRGCSSIQNFPEIECQIQYLRVIDLKGTAIEELPSSIEHVTGLVHLILKDCVNLKHLPSCLLQWKSLRWLVHDDCPNIVNFGMEAVHNGQSSPYIVSTRENEASSSTELFTMAPPTKSAISLLQDSSSLRFPLLYQLDLANSGLTKSNFFGPFHCFPNVEHLDLSHSDIISIPASIKSTFVRLRNLILNDCKKLQEIIEFPTNLEVVDVGGCISLESLPEISEVIFPRLYSIDLFRCYKVNMGNCMPNPLWNRASMIFPGNNIPDWFSYCKESTSKSHCCQLEIKGPPLCLDDIIGIAFCAVIETVSTTLIWVEMPGEEDVSQEVHLGKMDSDHVCLWYLPTEYLTRRASEEADHLRIIFESTPNSVNFKRCGVHLLYKQHDEQNAKDHENVDVHLDAPIKDIGNFANPIDGSPLSKRRRIDHDYDDDDHDIESNLYSQVLFPRHKLVETESVEKKITFYDNRKFTRTSHILRRLRVAANKSASFVLFSR
ncbi:disease resistance protein Roq1-like [Carya illinoinensis]|uniref:disease resistance protein Roq1-like n=1 Tax=Carya illinoinensis TaxID=32201 RepID=UPI001C720568|nr:disease resistance protein Roq1-like [Carya illinoinensis]